MRKINIKTTGLNVEAQSEIQRVMRERGWTRSMLARALGVSRVVVTQMLTPSLNRNLTLKTLEKTIRAMGYTVHLDCKPQFETRYRDDE